MYAVIKTGGKQYRVQPGDVLVVEKLAGEPGANVAFGEVLMLGDGDAVTLGAPTVAGASVSATLIETRKGEKVKIFKKIRRQGYRRTRGHRQHESVLRVTGIAGADGKETKWDGTVDMTTKAELDARARGLVFISPQAQAEAAAARKIQTPKKAAAAKAAPKAAKAPKVVDVEAAMDSAQTNAPVAEAPAKKAAAPKAEAKPVAEKKAAPAKAAAPKADDDKKAAAPKKAAAAPKKDKSAK
jgi:large subunit ribosomal protein L21